MDRGKALYLYGSLSRIFTDTGAGFALYIVENVIEWFGLIKVGNTEMCLMY
jgi:hypothetical protein